VSLRGSLLCELLDMVAAGLSPEDAATRLISEALTIRRGDCKIRLHRGVYVFQRVSETRASIEQPISFQ
jgi:hypothetical protein